MPKLEKLEAWSFRIFGKISPLFLRKVIEFKEYLERAKIKIYPETYVSLMFLSALATLPITILALIILYFYAFIPAIILVPTPIYVMIGFMLIPISKASDRAGSLEREMPFVAAYISVMASGGISPYTSFKRLSQIRLLPTMMVEAREIVKDVEIFGFDPLTAIQNAARRNPLDTYQDLLSGYASTVIIGGDVKHFLERKAEDIFKLRTMRVKAAAERLGMLLESFIIVMVLMSLCFYILFSVEQLYSSGLSSMSGMILYTYVLTPMLSMTFLYLAHSMQPKAPVVEMRPYKVFGACCAVAIVFFVVFTQFLGFSDLPLVVAIAILIATVPAAVAHNKISSKKTSIERGVNNFLRDLTEIRKTGLSPEKCIESLSRREYGAFGNELRKISSEISWGLPASKVILEFVKRTKSWMTQIVMFLLVETIDVGGGTIAMVESLARFSNLTQEVEKEKRMTCRPYIMMPYFATILLVVTTVMMLGFSEATSGIMGARSQPISQDVKNLFIMSTIIHSYIIGIVAGKISEESISAGFKHAAILVIIAILAAKLMPSLISFGKVMP